MSIRPRPRSAAHSAAQHHPRGRALHGHQLRHAQHLSRPPSAAWPPSPRPSSPTWSGPGPTVGIVRVVDCPQPPEPLVVAPAGDRDARRRAGRGGRALNALRRGDRPARVRHLRRTGRRGRARRARARPRPGDHRPAHRADQPDRPTSTQVLAGVVAASSVVGDHDRDGPAAAARRLGRRPRARCMVIAHGAEDNRADCHGPRGAVTAARRTRPARSSPGACSARARASSGRSRRMADLCRPRPATRCTRSSAQTHPRVRRARR